MKLFGKDLFTFKQPIGTLYDFSQHGILENGNGFGIERWAEPAFAQNTVGPSTRAEEQVEKPKKVKPKKTPKELFRLKALNDNKFAINVAPDYIKAQLEDIKEKLDLIGPEKKKDKNSNGLQAFEVGGVQFGREELRSIFERLENRLKLKNEFKDILDKYPHTTSALVASVIGENNHLRTGKADEFVPDFPKDAIKAMKEYNDMCIKLCNKKTNFYVIAKYEDFQKKNARRDPILIAQSPFGFFWQILGAWDDEMIYLGDL